MEGMSVADYLAIDRNNGGFGGMGDSSFLWVILIFLFFLGFNGNGLGFGANNGGNLSQVERDVLTTSCNTQKEVLESKYATQMGFQDMQGRLDNCCCSLASTIHSEGEATRALITQNTIDDLRDRLNSARDELGNLRQTFSIVEAVRPFPIPAYPTCSPYTSYGNGYYNGGCNGCNGCGNI